jgi:hypothetical protein
MQFKGLVEAVTPDGREGFVRLARPVDGMSLVLISTSTSGRIEAMNGRGKLIRGMEVTGEAEPGIDGFVATSVRVLADA